MSLLTPPNNDRLSISDRGNPITGKNQVCVAMWVRLPYDFRKTSTVVVEFNGTAYNLPSHETRCSTDIENWGDVSLNGDLLCITVGPENADLDIVRPEVVLTTTCNVPINGRQQVIQSSHIKNHYFYGTVTISISISNRGHILDVVIDAVCNSSILF